MQVHASFSPSNTNPQFPGGVHFFNLYRPQTPPTCLCDDLTPTPILVCWRHCPWAPLLKGTRKVFGWNWVLDLLSSFVLDLVFIAWSPLNLKYSACGQWLVESWTQHGQFCLMIFFSPLFLFKSVLFQREKQNSKQQSGEFAFFSYDYFNSSCLIVLLMCLDLHAILLFNSHIARICFASLGLFCTVFFNSFNFFHYMYFYWVLI